jgi:hypothetical protein
VGLLNDGTVSSVFRSGEFKSQTPVGEPSPIDGLP